MMTVPRSRFTNGSQLSKVVAKVSDIFRNHEYVTYTGALGSGSGSGGVAAAAAVGGGPKTPVATKRAMDSMLNGSSIKRKNSYTDILASYNPAELEPLIEKVGERLESVFRESVYLAGSNTRIMVPLNLVNQIAEDIIRMSDNEPCGLRGCLLYIYFEDTDKCLTLGQIKFSDRTVVPTFEMYLYLRRDQNHWHSLLPSKILLLLSQETVVVSECYQLSKRKWTKSLS